MKFLITGGAGFIGSELSRHMLNEGHEVVSIDDLSYGYIDNITDLIENKKFTFIQSSIMDIDWQIILKDTHIVFHLAGISSLPECESNPQKAFNINLLGTIRLIEAIKEVENIKIIFASTSAVYENNNEYLSTEDLNVSPDLIYSQSKLSAENYCLSAVKNYGVNLLICRFFNVYGPHQDFKRSNPPFTSYLVKSLLSGETPIIYNSGEVARDYIYSGDLVQILSKLSLDERDLSGNIMNITSGMRHTPVSILDTHRYSRFDQ